MRRLRVLRKAAAADQLDLRVETCADPHPAGDEVLVEIRAAGVNRSDVAAAMGRMPQAVWPRTPGRDWAGMVRGGTAGPDRPRGVRRGRRPGHHPRRHACQSPPRAARRRGGETGNPDAGGSRRTRRPVRHRARRVSSLGHAEAWRCRAGDGGERQGRPGGGADRRDARRARVRRHAPRRTVRPRALSGPHDRCIDRGCRRFGARGDRRPRRRHRLQHGRQSLFRRSEPGDGAWRLPDPDLDGRTHGAVRHLRVLSRPAQFRWHQFSGAGRKRLGRAAARTAAGFRQRPAPAISGAGGCALPVGTGGRRLSRGACDRLAIELCYRRDSGEAAESHRWRW